MKAKLGMIFSAVSIFLFASSAATQTVKPPAEWEKILDAARKEGKVVASIPPNAELRKGIEETFQKRFGITVESVPGRGAAVITRIVSEAKAGIRYFDLH